MTTYSKEDFDNSTQRPKAKTLGKKIGIRKGILIYIDPDRKHLKKDFPIPGWTGEYKRHGSLTPMGEAIFWLTFIKYHDKVKSLADLLIISNYMEKYLKLKDSELSKGIKTRLKDVVELIPSDKTDFEEFIQECKDLEMDV